ncbi:hypothetical protein KIH39_24080 [Telmatocola sphagniphila]|jgi:hypothetical protein|uniref:Uncharacterized protein n=1 Tax=Telmatocola sphagniphila TaxID=1123043 RepID=A0A8E6ET33_9BACT|nr:hypothetical protein [Telmatocola sphagniphila]QVL31879.1 hypothetical protein KIH39_24080 [Telmatocola sphagniphila]
MQKWTITLIFFAVGSLRAQGPSTTELTEAKEKYSTALEAAARSFYQAMKAEINRVENTRGLKPSEKVAILDRLGRERECFEKEGTLPRSEEYLQALYNYAEKVHKAQQPVMKLYDRRMAQALGEKKLELAKQLVQEKKQFDEQIPGRKHLEKDSKWVGVRKEGNVTAHITVQFERAEGELRGVITQTRAGSMKFTGNLIGNRLEFHTTEAVQGTFRASDFQGYVVDKKLLMNATGFRKDGRPTNDLVILDLKE